MLEAHDKPIYSCHVPDLSRQTLYPMHHCVQFNCEFVTKDMLHTLIFPQKEETTY